MSFKTNYSDVIICNRALSCLPESPIAMMDAPGIAARECRQHYSPVVRRVLTMHDWGLATKVESLAVSSDNPRREWTYAYAPPADLAFAIDVVPADLVGGNSNTNYFQGMQALLGGTKFGKFKRSDGKIYSNIEDASLVYTTLDITEDAFTEDFVLVVEKYLAAKLAMPITKRKDLADALEEEGDKMVNRAVALYRSQQGQTYGDEKSDTERVREGSLTYYNYGGGY